MSEIDDSNKFGKLPETSALPAPATYWQKVAEQERKKAADNLRLAAERASEIAELKGDLLKTDEDRAHWMAKCAGLEIEVGRLRKALENLRERKHREVEEDCWYSCPKSDNYCGEDRRDVCNCGMDNINTIIDRALKGGE